MKTTSSKREKRTSPWILLLAGGAAVAVSSIAALRKGGSDPALDPAAVLENRPEFEIARREAFDYTPPEPGSYRLPVIQEAGDGEVIGLDGRPQPLRSLLGDRIVVLSFIYTRCADPSACPQASGMLRQIHILSEKDPVLAKHVRLLTLSFDPGHDTPGVMAKYGRLYEGGGGGGADWLFLTTRGSEELGPLLEQYGQIVERKRNPEDIYGPLSHTVRVYLIDRKGQIRNIYSLGLLDPRLVVTDIRTLLLEEIEAPERS